MQYVLAGLEEQALKYKSKHDRTLVLVIDGAGDILIIYDGVDLLAKENKMLFIHLIDRAKYLANSHALKIILA
jgi:late competence protein required for DNA uptake (superfamily II DNA/RNA helicase)